MLFEKKGITGGITPIKKDRHGAGGPFQIQQTGEDLPDLTCAWITGG